MLSILLKDIVKKEGFYIESYGSLKDAIALMQSNQKGVVLIVNNEKPRGILTERDVVEILNRGHSLDERLERFLHKTLITAKGDKSIGYALNLMIENNVRRIIVTDNTHHFIGIVTQQDILKFLEEDFYHSTIKVKHIVDKLGHLINVSPHETLKNVIKRMVENRISAVAIMNDGIAEGVISERDILKLASQNIPLSDEVWHHMSTPIVSAHLDTALVDIVSIMNDKNIQRLIILDDDDHATNIVTIRDLVKNLESDYNDFLEAKLRHSKEILNLFPDMIIEVTDTDHEHFIVWTNEKVIASLGENFLGRPVSSLIPGEHWKVIYASLSQTGRVENMRVKKDDRVFEISGFQLETRLTIEQARIQIIMRDITQDIILSSVDELTGAYNRRFINEYLDKEIKRGQRMNKSFSLVICDIDNFKQINGTYGHVNGDTVLKSLSQIIVGTIRHQDVVGRYGGDEFMIILPETNNVEATGLIDRLRMKIESIEISLPGDIKLSITSSFGVATCPKDAATADDLLIRADERLYRAKNLGKNKVVFA